MTARQRTGNLPAEMTSLVGRGTEIAAVRERLGTARLVTLTGVGGVGKTRLALRVAADARRSFPGGVWLVELSALRDPAALAQSVVTTLQLHDQSARSPQEVLTEHLAGQHVLLVFDTCEHLVGACADLAETLLRAAPGLRILCTSRQPLGVPGEHTVNVPPLDALDDAMKLFAERALAVDPSFLLSSANRQTVARLCERLDGLPLAIELAAVRLRALSLDQLLTRLDDRFRLLGQRPPAGAPRHETLRTTIGWSHDLCTPAEQGLWARLSVFAGAFDLDAAESVCAGSDEVLSALIELVDKSIVLREPTVTGARFKLLDTLREYGAEWLEKLGETTMLRRRHRDHYLDLARRFDAEWAGPDQVAWYERISSEIPNIAAAIEFCLAEPAEHNAGLDLAGRLGFFWIVGRHMKLGRHYLDRALATSTEAGAERAWALWVRSWIALPEGDHPLADSLAAESREIAGSLDNGRLLAYAIYAAGLAAVAAGELDRGIALCQDASTRHTERGDNAIGTTMTACAMGMGLVHRGEPDRAIEALEEARRLSGEPGELWARSYCDFIQAMAELNRGAAERALEYGRAALEAKRRLHDHTGSIASIDVLAGVAVALGDGYRAARLLGAAQEAWQSIGTPQAGLPELLAARAGCEGAARALVGDTDYDTAFRQGLRLDLHTAIAYALGEEKDLPPAEPPGKPALTRREFEVADRLALGMSNREIAENLVIARRTVDSHVEHILAKLGFTSRTQIAAWISTRQS
ncbi:MAG TPA: LuxR C-terminal-related transcriptional regulator [Streptosporangiaceae bacterium]|nr:LuxR C-terminal-related transcriptional regulator [Streptosporangiaceae bacterium]